VKRDLDENGQDGEGYHCVCPVHGGQRGVRSSSQSQYLSSRSFRRWWRALSALRIICHSISTEWPTHNENAVSVCVPPRGSAGVIPKDRWLDAGANSRAASAAAGAAGNLAAGVWPATTSCSSVPKQIAEKSIHRSGWRRPRGRQRPARLVGEGTAGVVGARTRQRRPSTVDQSC
jgi:hypothetical protein